MRVVTQSVELVPDINLSQAQAVTIINHALGIPYSKEQTDLAKAIKRIGVAIAKGHTSVLEHVNLTLSIVCPVSVYKGLIRHRHCAFTIESTNYCKYDEFALVVNPDIANRLAETPALQQQVDGFEQLYKSMLDAYGPRVARDILPQSQVANVLMTTNLREWRYIIGLRSDPATNPLTNEIRNLIFSCLNKHMPLFFPMTSASTDPNFWIRKQWGQGGWCVDEDI